MEARQPLPEIHYGACNFLGALLVNQVSRASDARHGEAAGDPNSRAMGTSQYRRITARRSNWTI